MTNTSSRVDSTVAADGDVAQASIDVLQPNPTAEASSIIADGAIGEV